MRKNCIQLAVVLLLLAGFLACSGNSVENLLNQYEKEIQNYGQVSIEESEQKILEIEEQLKGKTLTEEQESRKNDLDYEYLMATIGSGNYYYDHLEQEDDYIDEYNEYQDENTEDENTEDIPYDLTEQAE
ncbi:MAG: hypothetical protein FWH41_09030 [Treponema sp.]|nr:hypothetical protein [Treponema sp.]